MPSYAYLLAYNYIAANLKSHFLLHGAVVSLNDDGLAIVGSSGSGKTTLMLELLLKKGFKFLSDDQVTINRTTHKIDPFPRSIRIRERALALFDFKLEHLEPQTVIGGQRKWFVDISDISENGIFAKQSRESGGEPCRLKYLVFLVNSLSESETEKDNEQRIELAVDSVNDELLEKLKSFAKTEEIHCRRMRSCYALNFRPETELSALEFERLCQSCGVWLLDVRKLNAIKPNFHATPKLQPIPRSTAVFELLKNIRNDLRENPCQTYMESAGALEDVECYRLSVGRLDEMARLICGLVIH